VPTPHDTTAKRFSLLADICWVLYPVLIIVWRLCREPYYIRILRLRDGPRADAHGDELRTRARALNKAVEWLCSRAPPQPTNHDARLEISAPLSRKRWAFFHPSPRKVVPVFPNAS
jgi:hypothetical protein